MSGVGMFAAEDAEEDEDLLSSHSGAVHFVVVVSHSEFSNERFVIALNDPVKIETARRILSGAEPQRIVSGALANGHGGFNRDVRTGQPWSWHMIPESIEFVDTTAEIYDAMPSYVEENRHEWVNNIGRFAPWIGRIESEGTRFKPGQFVNLSARALVGTGENVQIAGFVLSGEARKTVLIRAAGPSLTPLGVSNALADPRLELYHQRTGTILITNNDWSSDADDATEIENVAAQVGAFAWTRGSKDAAILAELPPGAYTAVVRGQNSTTGVALMEVYNADDPTRTRLVNLSARAQAKSGENVLIAGFVVGGVERKTILIRGGGPSLIPLGITGALSDPILELYDQRTGAVVATNDNWDADGAAGNRIAEAAECVGARKWVRGSADSALLIELEPGIYSAVVRGANNAEGVALMEVFDAE
jgi:hypothetical protein